MPTAESKISVLLNDPNPPKPWVLAVTIDGSQLTSTDAAEIMNQLRARGRVQLLVLSQSVNDTLTPKAIRLDLEEFFNSILTVDRESVTATVRELVSGGRRRCVLLTLTNAPESPRQ